ncbi:hypothetical protein C2E21_3821 [Chlorella sorokiniana]|uniref:Uncharacterized protein n=1 Tax=Chlorella sorokiniana TaxID=3076 RepID=A0A2P6TTF3_CHLSO|nr:hypothetical protein C2E21_3821 [Chlorella sorokiniana]|eukprot:PRW57342.1 hypothetical protein C2E21_3821 [Chlorella sorokiniana]
MEVTAPQQPTLSPALGSAKKVQFLEAARESPLKPTPNGKPAAAAAATAGASSELPLSHHTNALFSPERTEGGWTIGAQRSDQMEVPEAAGGGEPLASPSPLPSLGAASGASYTPASSTWLESARKVNDLQDRLASLEAALKDMESKAVAHLDKSLQEKVLATAAKIVQKRFLADKELDRKLQHQILQTAIKVVKRQDAAKAAAAASPAPAAAAPADDAGATPTRRLEFGQGEAPEAATMAAYVAHVEQGLGEVVRRLEKKVDSVAQLLDQNALELLEARLAGGVVELEARLEALEQRAATQRGAAAADASPALLERVAAVEAAMVEQSRAVADLLAALAAQGASQHIGAAVAAAQAQTAARKAAATQTEMGEQEEDEEAQRAGRPAASPAKAAPREQQRQVAQREPASQLHQRRAAAAKRSVLGDPARTSGSSAAREAGSAQASPRVSLPRLKVTHAAGTAQQIAMATARQQLARQAQRAREEAEAESPVWLSMVYLFGWGLLAALGVAAVMVGMTAALVKAGRLSQSDLEFLWRK